MPQMPQKFVLIRNFTFFIKKKIFFFKKYYTEYNILKYMKVTNKDKFLGHLGHFLNSIYISFSVNAVHETLPFINKHI
jgi:hypothetical protein